MSQPSDTIFVEVSDKDISSANILDTVKDVYKEGGTRAFYKGALPRAAKSALNIALQFFLYDSLKRLANVAPDDLKVWVWPIISVVLQPFLFGEGAGGGLAVYIVVAVVESWLRPAAG